MCVCVCVCVCVRNFLLDINHKFVWLGLLMCTLIWYLGFKGTFLLFSFFFFFFTHLYHSVGCLSMISCAVATCVYMLENVHGTLRRL